MKRTILSVLCALLLLPAMLCVVSAEDTSTTPTSQEVTQIPTATGLEQTTTTEPVDITTEPTTDGNTTATESEPTATTTARVHRMGTSMSVAYDNRVITVRVTDENGQGVRSAPLTVAVDGTMYAATTNHSGVATVSLATDPAEIVCLMEEFQGVVFLYDAAKASVVLATRATTTPTQSIGTTNTTATTPVTEGSKTTEETEAPTKAPTKRPLGPTRTLTTTDPEDGDVTQIVIITEATTTTATKPAAQQPPKNSAVPQALIVGLIVGGALLLIAAALLTYFFLIRKPRDEEEEATPIEAEEPVAEEPIATVVDLETDLAKPAAEEPSTEKPAPNKTVRLEDLFKGE